MTKLSVAYLLLLVQRTFRYTAINVGVNI